MSDRPDPTRVVADADVLAADVLVGGDSRAALDHLRAHSWTTLVASEPLLDDAAAVIEALADPTLAADWRERAASWATLVEHPAADHPALASAYRGAAAHLLTFDDDLRTARANASLKPHVETSVKSPAAFARLFDPAALYEATENGEYPGPDRDPRA